MVQPIGLNIPNFKFPGRGQRSALVAGLRGIVRIIMFLVECSSIRVFEIYALDVETLEEGALNGLRFKRRGRRNHRKGVVKGR